MPRSPDGLEAGVTKITGRKRNQCALKEDRTVWCWGMNSEGQLGAGDAHAIGGQAVIAVDADHDRALALANHRHAAAAQAQLFQQADGRLVHR